MTVTLATALLLQAATVALLRYQLGRSWLRRPAANLILISVVYDGVTQMMLLAPSVAAQDAYRVGVSVRFLDEANLILSACMLAFTIAYLLTRPEPSTSDSSPASGFWLARELDWRLLVVADLPLALLTYAGRGYNEDAAAGPGTQLATNLAVSFFLVLTVMAAAALVLRHGSRWVLAALLAQSAVLAAAGERTPVIACGAALMVVLAHAGVRLPRTQIALGGAMMIVAVLAVTGSRVTEGRDLYYSDSGAGARVSALSSGISAAGSAGSLATQAATRLDGVSFTAAVLQARSLGQPRLPGSYVPGSLLEVVPSFLWPAKLDHEDDLAPAQMEIDDDGLQETNFLPGLPGTYIGFLTIPWLIAFMALLGWIAGLAERHLLARCTAARLVLLAGAVQAAFLFDAGLPAMVVTIRSAVVLAAAVRVAAAVRKRLAPIDPYPGLPEIGPRELLRAPMRIPMYKPPGSCASGVRR